MAFNCWKNIKHLKMHNLLSAPANSARNIRQPYVFGSYVTVDYLTLHEHCLLPPVTVAKLVLRHVTGCYKHHEVDPAFTERLFIVSPQPTSKNYPLYPDNAFLLWAEWPKSDFDEFSLEMNIWIIFKMFQGSRCYWSSGVSWESWAPHLKKGFIAWSEWVGELFRLRRGQWSYRQALQLTLKTMGEGKKKGCREIKRIEFICRPRLSR